MMGIIERGEQIVPPEKAGVRLDRILPSLFIGHSRSELQQLIQDGHVFLNGKTPKKRDVVATGDRIVLHFPYKPKDHIAPEPMGLSILYEDEFLIAVNKPAGLVVHPAPGHWQGTFVNGLLAHCPISDTSNPVRPGIVHRLDKETSGVLIAAKTTPILHALSTQFHDRTVKKEYAAIVVGKCEGTYDVSGAIGRDRRHRQKMAIVEGGKEAHTHMASISSSCGLSFVRAYPHTGRTHQIRVHLASLGFPVLGDSLYGNKEMNIRWAVTRHLLHCQQICILHPISHTPLSFSAPLPDDMKNILEQLRLFTVAVAEKPLL